MPSLNNFWHQKLFGDGQKQKPELQFRFDFERCLMMAKK
jgi:hypothetical protein